MPAAWWSLMPLIAVAAGLVCLVVAVILRMLMTRELQATRTETVHSLQTLARRLLVIESRIDELENRGGRAPAEHQNPPAHAATKGSREARRAHAFLDVGDGKDTRNDPTLIVVPNLAAEEAESDGRAGSELGQRHGEVWVLAAAGVPPEEIARQTGQPIGQIELIVGLYRRLHSSRGPIGHARSH
jgi:hypothetical protein